MSDEEKPISVKTHLRSAPEPLSLEQQADAAARAKEMEARQRATFPYELDKMDERMVGLMIEYPGITKTKLAGILNVTRKTLYAHLAKPAVARALVDLQKNGVDLIKEVQTSAMRRMRRLIASPDERVALDAARFVLQPMFNQASLHVTETQEKVYRVQFGEGGAMYTDVEMIDKARKKLTPLELLEENDLKPKDETPPTQKAAK